MFAFKKLLIRFLAYAVVLSTVSSTAQNATDWQKKLSERLNNVVLHHISANELYDSTSIAKADYSTPLVFLMFRGTGWTLETIREHLSEVVSTYNTDNCRIVFRDVYLIEADAYQGMLDIDWATVYSRSAALAGIDLKIAQLFPKDMPRPVITLMRSSHQMYSAYAAPKEASKGFRWPMRNTAWITNTVNNEFYKSRLPEGYNPIAHELAHVLFNFPYHDSTSGESHILSDDFNKVNGTVLPRHCPLFRSSGL